ncbi:STAS domain-containing protein [Streptomyces sp. NPDC000880]
MAGHADAAKRRLKVAVRQVPTRDAFVLTLAGELDHDSVEALREALANGLVSGAGRILADCSDLRFCDSTGLNALLHSRIAGREAGIRLELVALQPPIARMFDITGAGAVFRMHASLDEALADSSQR